MYSRLRRSVSFLLQLSQSVVGEFSPSLSQHRAQPRRRQLVQVFMVSAPAGRRQWPHKAVVKFRHRSISGRWRDGAMARWPPADVYPDRRARIEPVPAVFHQH